ATRGKTRAFGAVTGRVGRTGKNRGQRRGTGRASRPDGDRKRTLARTRRRILPPRRESCGTARYDAPREGAEFNLRSRTARASRRLVDSNQREAHGSARQYIAQMLQSRYNSKASAAVWLVGLWFGCSVARTDE